MNISWVLLFGRRWHPGWLIDLYWFSSPHDLERFLHDVVPTLVDLVELRFDNLALEVTDHLLRVFPELLADDLVRIGNRVHAFADTSVAAVACQALLHALVSLEHFLVIHDFFPLVELLLKLKHLSWWCLLPTEPRSKGEAVGTARA
jgi:hypothetical protein